MLGYSTTHLPFQPRPIASQRTTNLLLDPSRSPSISKSSFFTSRTLSSKAAIRRRCTHFFRREWSSPKWFFPLVSQKNLVEDFYPGRRFECRAPFLLVFTLNLCLTNGAHLVHLFPPTPLPPQAFLFPDATGLSGDCNGHSSAPTFYCRYPVCPLSGLEIIRGTLTTGYFGALWPPRFLFFRRNLHSAFVSIPRYGLPRRLLTRCYMGCVPLRRCVRRPLPFCGSISDSLTGSPRRLRRYPSPKGLV